MRTLKIAWSEAEGDRTFWSIFTVVVVVAAIFAAMSVLSIGPAHVGPTGWVFAALLGFMGLVIVGTDADGLSLLAGYGGAMDVGLLIGAADAGIGGRVCMYSAAIFVGMWFCTDELEREGSGMSDLKVGVLLVSGAVAGLSGLFWLVSFCHA